MQGYEPLDVLKPVGPDIWIVDGSAISFYGLPFSTRMTVIRLENGDLFLHSPIRLTAALARDVAGLGRVRHLISPNWIHYSYIADWSRAFDATTAWASPGVRARAATRLPDLKFDRDLDEAAPEAWAGQIDQMIVHGSKVHQEVVFFHRAAKVLILTDLIENFEPARMAFWMRPLLWLGHVADPDGRMPADMAWTFRDGKDKLRAAVRRMMDWAPDTVILAHGRCYDRDAVGELRRAFRSVL
ncbi:MAG: DUF4336 domain-containing protein [bacterium]